MITAQQRDDTTLTWLFVRISQPLITLSLSFAPSSTTSFLSSSYRVVCIVAPNSESRPLPPTPPTPPHNMRSRVRENQTLLQAEDSTTRQMLIITPMIIPPANEASVPPTETPPFVPGGTTFPVVMSRGGEDDNMPSSEARVSPKQQAKCLEGHCEQAGEFEE